MFTVRNLGGVALFLLGTTYMWLMPMMATEGVRTTGTMWAVASLLALLAITGFTAATWGVFQRGAWWESGAIGSTVVGFVAFVPYWLAAVHAGETAPAFSLVVLGLGNVAVLVLLFVPSLEKWVNRHVIAGR